MCHMIINSFKITFCPSGKQEKKHPFPTPLKEAKTAHFYEDILNVQQNKGIYK